MWGSPRVHQTAAGFLPFYSRLIFPSNSPASRLGPRQVYSTNPRTVPGRPFANVGRDPHPVCH
jgi:hypothetical protein